MLDLMRGTEFAGRQITSYEIVETAEFHDVVLQEAGPGETARDLTELKTEMLALGGRGPIDAVPAPDDPPPARAVRLGAGRGIRLAAVHRRGG